MPTHGELLVELERAHADTVRERDNAVTELERADAAHDTASAAWQAERLQLAQRIAELENESGIDELRRELADTLAARDQWQNEAERLAGALDEQRTTHAREIAGLNTRIAQLTERIRVLEGAQPPTGTKVMKVGAIIGPQCHTVDAFVQRFGTPGVRRYFAQGDFDRIQNNPSVNADLGKWDRLISYKPPSMTVNRTRLLSCLNSIPKDGRKTVIMCQNEPERSDKSTSVTAWRPYVNDFIEQTVAWIDENDRDDVYPGWSFSYWRPLTDATISEWWPTSPNRRRAVFGIQPYDPLSRKTLEEQTKTGVDRWKAAGGELWMMSEVNTKRTGQAGADWWDEGLHWAAGYGCLFATVYDDVVGKDGPWCINDTVVQQAFKNGLMPAITVE